MGDSDFNITSSESLHLISPTIIIGTSETNLSFPCNIFPTTKVYVNTVVGDVTESSRTTDISSVVINFSTSLDKGSKFTSTKEGTLYGQNIVLSDDGTTAAIGSPYYNNTDTNNGRVDIYKNSTLLNTVYGDIPNAYFGTNLAISPTGSTVLMGSPAYNNGRGIFQRYQNGIRDVSVIGPDTNMQYGKNIFIDSAGNSIMYTDAIPNMSNYWTYYNFSTTDNISLAANVSQYSYRDIISNSFFNTSFNATNFQKVITNGTKSYVVNASSVDNLTSNISLVLTNASFRAVGSGWALSNLSSTYLTTANNDNYFAVNFFSPTNILNVYVGNFANTTQNYYRQFPLLGGGPIIANMNKKNILSVNVPSQSIIKLFSITDSGTNSFNNINVKGVTSLAANASVLAVGMPDSNLLKVYNIARTSTLALNVSGSAGSSYGSTVAVDAAGDVLVTTSNRTMDIYKNNALISSIVSLPTLTYTNAIVDGAGDVIVTTTPGYSGRGIVQGFTNINNLSGNVAKNTSTYYVINYDLTNNQNTIYSNNVNVMNTSYQLGTITNVSNVSSYVYNLVSEQMSFIGFNREAQVINTQSTTILNIGSDPLITGINVGNIGSCTNISLLNVSQIIYSGLSDNIAVGYQSLAANTSGISNNAFGYQALRSNVSGSANNAFGYQALSANVNSSNNAFGYQVLTANTTGTLNNAFGYQALTANTTGSLNNAYGFKSLAENTTGNLNNAFGTALSFNISGDLNNAFGYLALYSNVSGSANSAFGTSALSANMNSSNNAFGCEALAANNEGTANNAFGNQALAANTTGTLNNAFGYRALTSNVNGSGNNAFGTSALAANTNSSNNAFGFQALAANNGGSMNNAFGYQALTSNFNGSANNAFGYQSLALNANSSNNAFGYQALAANTVGTLNNAFGYLALTNTTNSGYNNAFGSQALAANTTGNRNNAFGYQSLISNIAGSYNTAIGDNANTSSVNNLYSTAIGANTFIDASYSTAIGYNASTSTDNQIVLGTEAETTYIPGNLSATFIIAKNMSVYSINFINLSTNTTVTNQNVSTNTVLADKSDYNFSTTSFTSLNNTIYRAETTTNSYFGENIVMSKNGATLVVGSPKYDSNKGRLDIYRDGFTGSFGDVGDAVNSYFGTNIVVSDDGTTVLMGSPEYQGGKGIFKQYYNGVQIYQAVGPVAGFRYGENMYFDLQGNGVMFSNAESDKDDDFTFCGVSKTGEKRLEASLTKSYSSVGGAAATGRPTFWKAGGFKTLVYFIAVNIFNDNGYRSVAILTKDVKRPGGPVLSQGLAGKGYYSDTAVELFGAPSLIYGIRSGTEVDSSGKVYKYFNAAITPKQPGMVQLFLTTASLKTLNVVYDAILTNGTKTSTTLTITLNNDLDSTGIQMQVNNKNFIMLWVPSSEMYWLIEIVNPAPIAPTTPSLAIRWNQSNQPSTSIYSLAYDAFRFTNTGYQINSTIENFKIRQFFDGVASNLQDVLQGYIPSYNISSGRTKTYYTPNLAINSDATTLVASSPYTNLIKVYKNFSLANVTPSSIMNISGISTYGQNIAIDSTGNILATSSPYYNSSSGYVQKFNLTANADVPVNRYISNISTININQINFNTINSGFKVNNLDLISTTNSSTISVTNINTSIYSFDSKLIDSYVNTSTTTLYNSNTLAIGNNSFTRVNIGGINTINIGIGGNALASNTTGIQNNAVGLNALASSTSDSFNNAFGAGALQNSNLVSTTLAGGNSAFGHQTLNANTTGISNSAFGFQALQKNITGEYNNAFGYNALTLNTGGGYNTAMGFNALSSNTIGVGNVAIGTHALNNNMSAQHNTAVGDSSMMGSSASRGENNTALGYNTMITSNASNSTVIGANATTSTSNQIVLGTSAQTVVCPGSINLVSPPKMAYSTLPSNIYTSFSTDISYNARSIGSTFYIEGECPYQSYVSPFLVASLSPTTGDNFRSTRDTGYSSLAFSCKIPYGIWYVYCNVLTGNSGGDTHYGKKLSISTFGGGIDGRNVNVVPGSGNLYAMNMARIIPMSSSTYYVFYQDDNNGTYTPYITLSFTRIA
jgi:hypothetical protein